MEKYFISSKNSASKSESRYAVMCGSSSVGEITQSVLCCYAEWDRLDPWVAPQGVVAWTRLRGGGGGDEAGRALPLNRRTPTSSSEAPGQEDRHRAER